MIKKLSHSVRKYIAKQKGVIRRQFSDVKKQQEMIAELYTKANSKA